MPLEFLSAVRRTVAESIQPREQQELCFRIPGYETDFARLLAGGSNTEKQTEE